MTVVQNFSGDTINEIFKDLYQKTGQNAPQLLMDTLARQVDGERRINEIMNSVIKVDGYFFNKIDTFEIKTKKIIRPFFCGIGAAGVNVLTATQTTLVLDEYYSQLPFEYDTVNNRVILKQVVGTFIEGGGSIQFDSNATGRRQVYVSSTASVNHSPGIVASLTNIGAGAPTVVPFSFGFTTVDPNEEIYFSAYQDSGSTLNVSIKNLWVAGG